ncbi:MAG TPA: alcohol dehydrogenase catalytic domain-containing protein [Dehalococcoidia bacterium]
MQTAAFVRPGVMELRDAPEPEPAAGQVVVAVSYSGVCGSDLHEYAAEGQSMRAAGVFQPVMGHEFTGTIAALGEGVEGLREGDTVVVHPGATCGKCWHCTHGAANVCAQQLGTGYTVPGAYAERCLVQASQCLPIPGEEWLEKAALTEPLAVALRAVNRGEMKPGETVFIAGGGPIGLLSLIAARRKGAGTIILSEPAESRRKLALQLGADHAIDTAQPASLKVRELTGGMGADLSIGAVGIPPTMDDALAATRRAGRIVIAGSFDLPYTIGLLNLIVQEQAIIATFGYVEEVAEARDLICSGEVDVSPFISRTVALDDLPATFEDMTRSRDDYQKVLVRP